MQRRSEEFRFEDRDTLAATLAESLIQDLGGAVAARGAASLVVSGGSTPLPLFHALREAPLPWERIAVTLADERWVEPEDAASNEGFVRRELLVGEAATARFAALKSDAATPEDGAVEAERRIAEMAHPFDVLILGMGEDGHTASLFPGAPELAAGLDLASDRLALAVHPPDAPHARLSLTLPAILDSRRILLHITGEGKRRVYERALEDGPDEDLPIRAVLRRAKRLEVWWAP